MDRISDSDSEDAGSIPAGATITNWIQPKPLKFLFLRGFSLITSVFKLFTMRSEKDLINEFIGN